MMSTRKQDFFSESKAAVEKYIHYKMLLMRLKAAEKISRLSATFFASLLIGVLSFFIVLFLSMMAAWYFAELLGSKYEGFGIISAFYLIVLIVIIVFRKRLLEKIVTDAVINILFEKTAEEHESSNDTK